MAQKASKRVFDKTSIFLSRLAKREIRYLFLLIFSFFFAEHAQAATGCTDVTSYWGAGVTTTDFDGDIQVYTFNVGEKLSWTASFSGAGTSGRYAAATITTQSDLPLNADNKTGNNPVSGGMVFQDAASTQDVEIVITADNRTGTANNSVTLQVTCAQASTDATLSTLSLSSGSLSPAFSSGTTSYTASVANSVSSIKVTPTGNNAGATIKVNGATVSSGSESSSIPLNVGSNTITVVVTPEYGATKTYTITVTRAAPTPPAIASISPTSGSISGGTAVNITGTDLSNITSVKFGTTAASSFTPSATSITATTPAHTVGAVDVVVSDGTNTSTLSNAFTYTPALSFSPTAGTLTGTNVGANYTQTITASGGTAPYTYGVSGTLPATLSLNTSTGVIAGTPTTAGNYSFSITETDANNETASVNYTLNVAAQAPVANAVTATVAADSSANAITLNITGGTAASVAVASQPSHGTATASGTSITYTPTTGYSGTDSFTYTATNNGGTSTPATVSITVSPPPQAFTFSPAAGTLTLGTVGTNYIQTITASGGSGSYTYAVTSGTLPTGLSLDTSTGVISGTPTTAANYSFTITATDANSATSSAAYTLAVADPAPVASAVSETVAANSSANAITLNITGGAAVSVAVNTPASHGTATASGTSITYTPTAGYSGTDSFTYTATNASGTSAAATVSIIVSAPTFTFSPSAGTLTAGTTGTSYTQTIAASGGSGSYTYAVTSGTLPAGLSLDTSTGVISGTPTTAANYSFTITATDANSATSSAAYTLAVADPAPVANAVSETVAANSSANAITLNITGGAAVSVAVDTPASHGTATASGTSITYTPTAGYSGTDSFTYTATNASGTSAAATVSIIVSAPTLVLSPPAGNLATGTVGVAYSQTITVSGGTEVYDYQFLEGNLPTGLSLSSGAGSSKILSGTPSAAGTNTIKVKITDHYGATVTFSYSITINDAAPVANAVSTTVAANSSGNVVPLSITGTATAVTVASQPSHGTATASGTSITYTPTTGYSGTDSFTYTATNASGTSAAATVSITVSAPTFTFSPSAGTLTAGTTGTSYTQTIAASGGSGSYTYAVTSGTLPTGLSLDTSTGVISGTPTTAANYSFTITATDANSATSSAAYTLAVADPAPVANAVSETVAANSSANAIALNITGGAAVFVAVDTPASHGTATASGTSITYTPTAGYSGADSFTYTATNASGTSAAATVSITVSAPTFTFSPSAGTLTAGTTGTSYTQTIAASGGSGSYTYAVTSGTLPAGLSLNTSTGVISGTPTTAANYSFTITATDANSATSSAAYTLAVADPAPVANAVSETVAANSSANAIALNITGGAAVSVAVDTPASHGTATASGTSITYTPTTGYSGTDSFTYTATNTTGTSTPATVTITITAPTFTFSPAAGNLTAATVGVSYSETVTASGGTASYTYAVTSGALPTGLSLNTSTGEIYGTPTTAQSASFTITATDANSATSSAAYTLNVTAAVVNLIISPSAGSLTDAMVGEKYDQQITASGGNAPLTFSVVSGNLPDGLTLSSSGVLSGTLAANTQNDYSFTVQVTDAQNASATAIYQLKVKERSVTVASQTITVPEGSTPPDTRLDKNATGGPFNSGQLVSVEPPNAGTATLTMGDYAASGPVSPVGWYLKFTPTTGYSGSVVITFSLSSGIGSNTGTITYHLNYNPAAVATEVDGLVRDFVKSRQSMISSTIKVPGLLERRHAENAQEPVTTRVSPSPSGMTLGFSTSLAQLEAYQNNADRAAGQATGGATSSPFNVWLSGAFLMHNRNENDSKWGSFGMLSAGADYLLTDKALVGVSFHLDRMTDPTDTDAKLTGNGWLFGPYSSLEITKGVFWDTSLLYGGSANNIDTAFWDGTFDTRRMMADTAIKGQWYLDDATVFTPKLRAVYFSEQVKDYTVYNATGDALTLDGFTSEQLRVSLGAEIARKFTLNNDTKLTPKIGLTGGFSGIDGSGAFGTISTGVSIETASEWNLDFSLLFNLEGDGDKSGGARARVSKGF